MKLIHGTESWPFYGQQNKKKFTYVQKYETDGIDFKTNMRLQDLLIDKIKLQSVYVHNEKYLALVVFDNRWNHTISLSTG